MSADTLHRHDEGGPTASVECSPDGLTALATWSLPPGQLLPDHPELGTGGYVYMTLHETPTDPLPGSAIDFTGALLGPDTVASTSAEIETGVEYRAHVLVAYETGEAWHNDTIFTCHEVTPQVSSQVIVATPSPGDGVDVLPFTGIGSFEALALLGVLLLASGLGLLRRVR